jgi:hypothetical protein
VNAAPNPARSGYGYNRSRLALALLVALAALWCWGLERDADREAAWQLDRAYIADLETRLTAFEAAYPEPAALRRQRTARP